MKIVFDYQIFSWQKYGGISRYYCELASNLAAIGAGQVSIVSPVYVNGYIRDTSLSQKVNGLMIPQIRKTGRIVTKINQILSAPLMFYINPNIVHETYYSGTSIVPRSAKSILTVYDMIHENFSNLFPAWDRTSENKARAVARADHIICISENTRRDLVNILGVDPAKTSVIHLGFTLKNPSSMQVTQTYRPYLLYVGQRDGYKNFDLLLRAYSLSKDLMSSYDLVAFGGGSWKDSELSRMRALAINMSQLKNIQGDDSMLASLYRNASVFIYPSQYEGFGIPPLEAMSFGCPVACSNASSLPEVVGNAAEFFDPFSVEGLQSAIGNILNNLPYREELIRKGFHRIRNFSWRRCAEQTLQVYRKVLI